MKEIRRTRTIPAALAALGLTAALGLAGPAPASAAYCGITWGSQAKTAPVTRTAPITNVRAGQHQCFDRMVVDISGRAPGYRVSYVPRVYAPGSGAVIPLRGQADIQVDVHAPAYNDRGQATYRPANRKEIVNVNGYRTFRQLAYAGSFEGSTTFGLGVRARLPFRVFTVAGPGNGSRVVIDVAHRW